MTEAEWLACQKITPMFTHLRRHASERKFYLAGCAAVRLVWKQIREESCRRCVEVAEAYADGAATRTDLARAYGRAESSSWALLQAPGPRRTQADRDYAACRGAVFAAMPQGGHPAAISAMQEAALAGKRGDLWARQCDLLRDIFQPFRPVLVSAASPPAAILSLALAAYTERDPESGWLDPGRLAVLADALEEGGCRDAELLAHLRSEGMHVRGCWALDLVLGRR